MSVGIPNNFPHLRKRPSKISVGARWMERVEDILDNGRSCDMSSYFDDLEEPYLYPSRVWNPNGTIPPPPEYPYPLPPSGPRGKTVAAFIKAEAEWSNAYLERAQGNVESLPARGLFEVTLEIKRSDEGYDRIVESLREHGFTVPCTVQIADRGYIFGDGHHRLAAAIDLGIEYIPVQACVLGKSIATDSGEWVWGGNPRPPKRLRLSR